MSTEFDRDCEYSYHEEIRVRFTPLSEGVFPSELTEVTGERQPLSFSSQHPYTKLLET